MPDSYRFLHLEDNGLDAELVQSKLTLAGITAEFRVVSRQADYEAALQQPGWDLILADYLLPGYDGLRALELARRLQPEAPFIFVSGEIAEERAIESIAHGATDYVLKTRLSRLAPAVQRALREGAERRRRQAAEAAAQAEREWLRVTLASIGDAVIATDTRGQITFLNAVAQTLTGWSAAEAISRPAREVFHIVHETTRAEVESPIDQVLREGSGVGLANHTVLIRKDGAEVPIDDSGAPIRAADGQLLGVVLVFRDIRGRRQAEAELRAAKQLLDKTFASLDQAVLVVDPHTRSVISANPAVERVFGWRLEDVLGRNSAFLHASEEHYQAFGQQLFPALNAHGFYQTEYPMRRADGSLFASEIVVTEFGNEAGERTGVVSVVRDITERKQAEAALLTAAEAARQSAARAASLQQVTAALAPALSAVEVARIIVHASAAALGASATAIYLVEDDQQFLRMVESVGYPEPVRQAVQRLPVTAALPGPEAFRSQEPMWLRSNADLVSRYPALSNARAATSNEAIAVIPLLSNDRAMGVVALSFAQTQAFELEERSFLLTLAGQCAQALERARLFAETQSLNADLERRVQVRTEELEISVEELRVANEELEHQVAQREAAEAIIRQSERHLAEAQQLARLGSWYWNVAANTVAWSDELYRIYGQPPDYAVTYENFLDLVHPQDRGWVRGLIAQAFRDHRPFEFEHRIVRPDGAVRVLQARGQVELDAAGHVTGMRGTGQDVTERKAIEDELRQSREELRQLSARQHSTREEERQRMAREIHDELGGALTGLKMQITSLRAKVQAQETDAALARIEELLRAVDNTVRTVRRMATELRPALLDDFGLVAAIEWQLNEFASVSGLACRLETTLEEAPLPPDHATALFRVFQETLTNVARHAQATAVEVRLERQEGWLLLHIRDNGRGIRPEEALGRHSLGLLGMRERIRALAGELTLHGAPGAGTTVTVRVPLQ